MADKVQTKGLDTCPASQRLALDHLRRGDRDHAGGMRDVAASSVSKRISAAAPTATSVLPPGRSRRSPPIRSTKRSRSPSARSRRRRATPVSGPCSAMPISPAGRFASAEQAYKDALSLYQEPAADAAQAGAGADRPGQERPRRWRFLDAGRGHARSRRLRARAGACRPSAGRGRSARPGGPRQRRRCPRAPEPCARLCLVGRLAAGADRRLAGCPPGRARRAGCSNGWRCANPAQASDQVAALIGVTPAAVRSGPAGAAGAGQADRDSAPPRPLRRQPEPVAGRWSPRSRPSRSHGRCATACRRAGCTARCRRGVASRPPTQVELPSLPPPASAAVPAAPAAAATRLRGSAAASRRRTAACAWPKRHGRCCSPWLAPQVAKRPKVQGRRRQASLPRERQVRRGRPARRLWLAEPGAEALGTPPLERFASLRDYAPISARFDSPQRARVYRLSVKGFASRGEATRLCAELKPLGRQPASSARVAGDRPIQLASR